MKVLNKIMQVIGWIYAILWTCTVAFLIIRSWIIGD